MRTALLSALAMLLLLAGCGDSSKTVINVTPGEALSGALLRRYRVPSGSMEPTLRIGQVVQVQAGSYAPKVGDIVVFRPPESAELEQCGPDHHTVRLGGEACAQPIANHADVRFIKRIVAGPGDTLSIAGGHVIRNGVRQEEPFIRGCGAAPECDFPKPIRIPSGDWFVMGDNRGESDDSRFWGPIPASWMIGPVQAGE